MRVRHFQVVLALAFYSLCTSSLAQLRVCTYNVTNYTGGRVSEFQTIFYESFQGRSLRPDVIAGQEFISASSVTAFRNLLNSAPGGPNDWQSANFIDGTDTESAFFYRSSRVQFLGTTVVAVGSSSTTNQPRNTYRYDFRPVGYSGASATMAIYSTHMKAGTSGSDEARRLIEAQRIRDNAETLPSQWTFAVVGDFNVQSSSDDAYQELTNNQLNNEGRAYDPIKSPGAWNDSLGFRFVHTQDPAGVGMDDRYDFILLSSELFDGQGFEYRGNSAVAYSTTTWNDPNHSYRVWGNDGTSFNTTLTVTGNTMVGPIIAQALIDSSNGQGHLPVYADFNVPPKSFVSTTHIEFGDVPRGTYQPRAFDVRNNADTNLWTSDGIGLLRYSMTTTHGFHIPPPTYHTAAGTIGRRHYVVLNTMTPGEKFGTLTLTSNDPDVPSRVITLHGRVLNGPPVGIVP